MSTSLHLSRFCPQLQCDQPPQAPSFVSFSARMDFTPQPESQNKPSLSEVSLVGPGHFITARGKRYVRVLNLTFTDREMDFLVSVYHLLAQLALPLLINGEGNELRWKETSVSGFSRELHLRSIWGSAQESPGSSSLTSIWGSAQESQSEDDLWVEEP